MENFENTLFTCFEILNFSFDNFLTDQNQRLIFQKYGLFIDEIFGFGVGRYSLYIHGPYNSQLASVGYTIAKNLKIFKSLKKVCITDRANNILNILREVFQPTLNDTRTIEVYSTYFYLLNKESMDSSSALNKTVELKKHIFSINAEININDTIKKISNNLKDKFSQNKLDIKFNI